MPLCRSAAPQIIRSLVPAVKCLQAMSSAASDEAQAASTVKLGPPSTTAVDRYLWC